MGWGNPLESNIRRRIAHGSGVRAAQFNARPNQFNPTPAMRKQMGKFQRMLAKRGGAPAGLFRR